jgi:hypothetical protein
MNAAASPTSFRPFSTVRYAQAKQQFRERFQRSLRSCLRRGFCIEESFGMIWMETWEEVPISEEEQGQLYEELIQWAKKAVK